MLRISPGVKPDTHDHIATGQLDSKFGFSIESGAARKAVEQALAQPNLELVGLHSHIGSQIFALGAYEKAMAIMLDLLVQLLLVISGFVFLFSPHALTHGTSLGTAPTWHSLLFAVPLAMLAYTGLETVANLAEEARRPGVDLGPVARALAARDILVRHFAVPGLRDALRITVGTDAEVDALLAALGETMRA